MKEIKEIKKRKNRLMRISVKSFIQWLVTEALAQRCSVKKVFLEILRNSQENTGARVSFLIKLQA